MNFIGWIPNLRGRLSFDTIGSSTKPYPYEKTKEFHHSLVSQSNRKLNDSALPRLLRKILFECKLSPFRLLSKFNKTIEKLSYHSGDFKFSFYYLEPDELEYNAYLTGYVIIEPNAKLPSQDCKEVLCSQRLLKSMNISGIQSILDRSLVVTKIKIDRDGFCELSNLYVRKIQRENLLWTSSVQDGFNQFVEESIHQTYYFIKDVCHQHQHHDSKTDNLLPLAKCNGRELNRVYEELSIKVFKSLYRLILKKRRSDSIKDFYSMKGILCYLKSFRSIASKRKISVNNFHSEDDTFLSGSIEAKSSCISAEKDRKKNFIGMLPSIVSLPISFLALCFAFSSMVMIYSNKLVGGKHLVTELSRDSLSTYFELIQFLISHPISFFGIMASVFLSFFFVCSDLFKESRFYNDFWRIVFGFKKQKVIGVVIMSCALLLMYKSIGMIEPQMKIYVADTIQNLLNNFF